MKYTYKYRFNLPDGSDDIDINKLNANFTKIDMTLNNELEPVEMADTFQIISASGSYSFYHGTLAGFFDGMSLLNSVETTFGSAEFGNHYGDFSAQPGSQITLYVRIYFDGQKLRWDEYYNDTYGYEGGDDAIEIGTAVASDYEAGGSTRVEFSYIDDNAAEKKIYSLRNAILELAMQIRILQRGVNNG